MAFPSLVLLISLVPATLLAPSLASPNRSNQKYVVQFTIKHGLWFIAQQPFVMAQDVVTIPEGQWKAYEIGRKPTARIDGDNVAEMTVHFFLTKTANGQISVKLKCCTCEVTTQGLEESIIKSEVRTERTIDSKDSLRVNFAPVYRDELQTWIDAKVYFFEDVPAEKRTSFVPTSADQKKE
jgi:hypothetical protein